MLRRRLRKMGLNFQEFHVFDTLRSANDSQTSSTSATEGKCCKKKKKKNMSTTQTGVSDVLKENQKSASIVDLALLEQPDQVDKITWFQH